MEKRGDIDFFDVFVYNKWYIKGAIIFVYELAHEMG